MKLSLRRGSNDQVLYSVKCYQTEELSQQCEFNSLLHKSGWFKRNVLQNDFKSSKNFQRKKEAMEKLYSIEMIKLVWLKWIKKSD